MEEAGSKLRRMYAVFLGIPAIGFIVAASLVSTGRISGGWAGCISLAWVRGCFIGSVCFAVAMPLLYRAYSARRFFVAGQVSVRQFYRFQRNLTVMALCPSYLALAVYTMQVPVFFQSAILVTAFYGMYYFYPSDRRLALDRQMFNVEP